MTYELKRVAGKDVLFVMAVDAEYGPFLRSRFLPLMTGVGPVEAAVSLTKVLTELEAKDRRPSLIVSLGSAGSAKLEQTEVYQVASLAYRDMDASPLGFEKGATPFLELPAVVELPLRIPGVPAATLSTGGNIISGAAYQDIAADMVDMESFAILRAAQAFDVPLIGLRGISDGKADLTHVDDWKEYLHVVDKKLAIVVDILLSSMERGVFWF
ncbi:5'-methylthioadenosine/S-adenosylhomocysteine nucleosidase [Rhizobium halophytocola]|uniref:Adenosylhomocysteine nucleosidase n=1 Tax=Rhizobium halophytocola TaxID=735519 RepID=A0ABS4E0F2_9HYPH|nr:5'-methylthioadenosine/S-adenosylhomocysteine nucleosidase [Rhizobium halophytocola]MBP1851421.1 adenosylhomocysteine nucleosidase [Rhizobium halophytocola]